MKTLSHVLAICLFTILFACCIASATTYGSHYGVVDRWGGGGGTGELDIIMQNLGAKWIRTGFDWDEIETADNVYDWVLQDSMVNAMTAIGVNCYLGISYTPAWARPGGTQHNTPPTDFAKYTDFMTVMVNRYKDRVKYWGLWNEPNLSGFWNGTMDSHIHNIVLPGIVAIKAADPTAKVVVGELATVGQDVNVLQNILEHVDAAGLHNQVDVVCTHAYGGGDTVSGRLAHLDAVRTMMVSIGWGDKDFWCTETSIDSSTQGEQYQSDLLIGLMQGMDARPWWKKTFWYTLYEGADGGPGLTHPNHTPKLSYTNYHNYIVEHADDAEMVSDTIPTPMVAGRQYYVSVTVKNTGTITWNDKNVWKLGGVGDSDPFAGTRQLLNTGDAVAPDQTKAFWFMMTAPATTGTYTTDWQMVHESVHWYGHPLTKQVVVNNVPDTTPPDPVTGFNASVSADQQVTMFWTNPTTPDATTVMIRYKTTGYPTSASDGTLLVDKATLPGALDSFVHTNVPYVTHYYSAFAHDATPNYAAKADANATPTDVTPPGLVTNIAATTTDHQITLSWHNPSNPDLQGVVIRYKNASYPSGPADGNPVVDKPCVPGTDDSFVHTGLTNARPYYYSLFTRDAVPNYSAKVTIRATPYDDIPPFPLAEFKALSGDGQISLNWTNPTADFTGARMAYSTVTYPVNFYDPTQLYDDVGTSLVHPNLVNGTRYYYSAFAHDAFPNYASAVNATAVAAARSTIAAARGAEDGPTVLLSGKVTAVFSDCFYIQDAAKYVGIKVVPTAAVQIGQTVEAAGVLSGHEGERCLNSAGNTVNVIDSNLSPLLPAAMGARSLGGVDIAPYPLGVIGGQGANNIGLLVRVWGRVTQRDPAGNYFYVDDDSDFRDGTQTEVSPGVVEDNLGVRIEANPGAYPKGSYVVVTGISRFQDTGLRRQILPRPGEIVIIGE